MKFEWKFVLLAFVSLFLLSATLGTSFITQAAYEQTINSDSVDPFPQAGKFYTLAGREIDWEIVAGEKTTHPNDFIVKWSVQDVDGDVAILNKSLGYIPISSEGVVIMIDVDYEIATNRTILWGYEKRMCFTAASFQWSDEWPLDMDVGENTGAWYPTDLHIGALVTEGWRRDDSVPDEVLLEVVGEEVVQILGEKQDCWILRLPPLIGMDGWVSTYTEWVDKDTGIPLKVYDEDWALDGSSGFDLDCVLVNTNIDLGPESALEASPIYTPLTVPTSLGFPEAGKFYTWYYFEEGWYMSGATNVTEYLEGILTWFVVNVTGDEALVYRILWDERLCETEGVGELEQAEICYFSYRIGITNRTILEATGSWCGVNMTSLTYEGPWDLTSLLAGDIGEETNCWLPTNLYIGAAVNITWTFDRPWKPDNATYTVIDEEIISALGEPQACWVLHLLPTPSVDGSRNWTETYYSDKDIGIPLRCVGEVWAVNGSSASEYALQLMDTNVDLRPPFPQPGKFYTLAGRAVVWEILDGKNVTSHSEEITKWSVQDVVGDVAFVNRTYVEVYIRPQAGGNYTDTYDFDYQIATNRTILSAYWKWMSFTTNGFQGSGGGPLDEDVGEHTWAWFPTDLHIGAYVLVSWTWDHRFLGDMLYEVVGEQVIRILGEKQDCWMLRMPPSVIIDGTQGRTETYWVDKDTGVPLKLYEKGWALDDSSGFALEVVLVNTNINLGPESTQTPSPTYTLKVPTTPGFPEAGKFYTWYDLYEGWYMNGATNVTYYSEELLSCWVVNVTDNKALVYIINWSEYLCEAQGVEQLEYVGIWHTVYRIGITTREILEATRTIYVANMTSLAYGGPWDETPLLAGDIGEETYCWLPTNLYIGAAVNITCTTDRPWKVDNGTYTVVDEEIISALGQPQACWVLYMPPTPSIDGTWNHSKTYYSDKDVGILLELVGEGWAVNGSEAYEYALQLIDTNVDLCAPPDTTPPVITVLSPENKTYATSSVPLNFTVDEAASWIGYSLDGQTNVTIAENKTLSGLQDGPHHVVVYANDTAGNMGASDTVYFTVDTTPPNITNVSQIPLENNVLPEDEVKVNATVTDDLSVVKKVTLVYAYANSSGIWIRVVDMTNLEGNVWNATIPAFPYCTNVTYTIIAEDNAGNTKTTEEKEYECKYHVIPEFPAAIILPLFIIATIVTIILRKTNWQKQHGRTKFRYNAGSLSENERTPRNRQRP